jgi:hypothetical protein
MECLEPGQLEPGQLVPASKASGEHRDENLIARQSKGMVVQLADMPAVHSKPLAVEKIKVSENFNGTGWYHWSFQWQLMCKQAGVWRLFTGEAKPPSEPSQRPHS